ncbi:MAG: hypothetical protein IJQ33_06135 [Clostridia bacterium]|nr:hypothetical protein [Clostridia bacterium]
MKRFTVSLAGVTVGVESQYDEVYELCEPYLCQGAADFSVGVQPGDIAFERKKSVRAAVLEGLGQTDFPDSYLETLAVYRKIAVGMLRYDTFLMHGSAVCVDGEAYLFTAASGTGKTTHTRLWLSQIPGAFVVNGDKPLIRLRGDRAEVCGTPWAGKEGMQTNTVVPLRAICLLARGKENRIEETTFRDLYPVLFQQSYRPTEKAAMEKTMELVKRLGESVKLYRLQCNMDPEAALTAYNGMRGA